MMIISWEEMSDKISSPRPVNNGFIAVSCDHTSEKEVEVVFISRPEREVLLYCCSEESSENLLKEINVRKQFNFSPVWCQRLYNKHYVDGRRVGCSGRVICVAFERPLATLSGVSHSLYSFTQYALSFTLSSQRLTFLSLIYRFLKHRDFASERMKTGSVNHAHS